MANRSNSYSPRTGTKVAVALDLIAKQPRTARELCTLLYCTCSAVRSMLIRPLSHGFIIKTKDKTSRLYFAQSDTASQPYACASEVNGHYALNQRRINKASSSSSTPSTHKTSKLGKSTILRGNNRKHENELSCASIASHSMNDELTIAVNGKSIKLDASQRQQLFSYLQKIHGAQ